jgi:hypothetical protein|tara:strand:+ start:1042 stop:1359 length:318 start_codon:yes stop_codon:yes gene_type:complete
MEPEKSLIKEFLSGGWLVPLIGAAAMFARLLSGNNGLSLKQQFKRILTAAIAAGIAWFVLEQTDVSSLTKAITYGIIGVVSPEFIGGIVRLGQKFEKNPEKFIKK